MQQEGERRGLAPSARKIAGDEISPNPVVEGGGSEKGPSAPSFPVERKSGGGGRYRGGREEESSGKTE